jgi:hypothetical protein
MSTARTAPGGAIFPVMEPSHVAPKGPAYETDPALVAARSGGVVARGGVREGELCFLGSLHELVAIGLYRPALDALVSGNGPPSRPPIDRAYLLKILEEEVSRQFGHPLRAVVELVLNAIDATPERPALVEVRLTNGMVEVVDTGVGMSLRAILSRLLLPFATDKRPGVDLGRFGVGFFSVIGLGLPDPQSLLLEVETGEGVEGWSLRVCAEGPEPSSLVCTIRRLPPSRGTRVRIRSALIDSESVRAYLRDALHFFPPEHARIAVDGVVINDGRYVSGGKLYSDALSAEDPSLSARFHLGGRALAAGISAATYHAGVKVESCLAIPELTLIDFPGAVELTEGRDALKPGRAFRATAAAFHRRLAHLARSSGATRRAAERVAEIAAQISALMLQSAAWSEVAPELARVLLGPDRYLVSPERREGIVGFLGPSVAPSLFVPESFWAEREWQGFLPGERDLLERELFIDPIESLSSLARRRPDLAGLSVLMRRTTRPESVPIALTRGRRLPPGSLPCLGTRQAILLREDSHAVRRPVRWADVYALRVAFDRASGLREPDLERELIVSDPIGAGGNG